MLVEQPYRVAGRRSPPPASHLDTAWIAIVESLRTEVLENLPVIVGGRSMGGRVALRTVEETGAVAVLCLAFPLEPPGRKNPQNRLPELEAVRVPVLVVQGERDPFGIPPPGAIARGREGAGRSRPQGRSRSGGRSRPCLAREEERERMMGLEPTTFCMARNERHRTRDDRG